ncbi:Aldo/keto reductase family [Nakaseomyces glabratus]|nr:Aldo/keto reductase family [Nakaseomyces glabratus]KAH7596706.1 Aldo/keto reductase family [Nakaseomyces glabratus]KAI8389728.1 Aldo/keto reductase family [Nakaseomyces glabratus]KAI8399633.1 Aldo/keto reductase family [Nakaseomyces glabratus]KTB10560.1 putative pyridoxal reductase [Nakaseomyces glabratus]
MSKIQQIRNTIRSIGTGYGLMSLTWKAVPTEQEQAFGAMKKAIDLARASNHIAFFNVGEFYGKDRVNLHLVRDFFKKYPELREHVIISCKGAMDLSDLHAMGKYDDVVKSVEACTEAIGGFIEIFEPARLDMDICKEGEVYPKESIQALKDLCDKGVIGAISLSEVDEKVINAVAADFGEYLACVEVELSLFCDDILHNGVAKACSDHNMAIICYSPLGKGILTGQITKNSDIPDGDFRKMLKSFSDEALQHNQEIVSFIRTEIIEKRPAGKEITLPQVALAWIKHWNGDSSYPNAKFIPIPSGSSAARVAENFDEEKSTISDEEFKKLNKYAFDFKPVGARYEFVSDPTKH